MAVFLITLTLLGLAARSIAQYLQPPQYSKIIQSPLNPKINISYREPEPGTCNSVFASQRQYTGYISLPPFTLAPVQQNYSINTFFWFVEARTNSDTAPLSIFINGGPGSSSMIGFFQEIGPCEVVQMADGSYGTRPRLWGWDRGSNMLFIDQPVQVGLSFDTVQNFSHDFYADSFGDASELPPNGLPPFLFSKGTFSSQKSYATANTTEIAARAVWHFLQGFLSAFPQYNPGTRPDSNDTLPTGINLFTESYGGIYGPAFAQFAEQQNQRRLEGEIPIKSTLEIKLTSLGIINGLIDQKVQMQYYPKFAYNNTYGIMAIDQLTELNDLSSLSSAGGCNDLIVRCRAAMDSSDPNGNGDVASVNEVCSLAQTICTPIQNSYLGSGRSVYDIRQQNPSAFPSNAYMEYLNTPDVQKAIGAQVNYTDSSDAVFAAFLSTGDAIRDNQIPAISSLLDKNIRVALIYGDADYICNWYGGEAVSLAVANSIPEYTAFFPTSGYAKVVVNGSYVGGAVRQFGNLSFVRIYNAGHQVPAYQPETAFTVFARIIQGTAVATGEKVDMAKYRTSGPLISYKINKEAASSSSSKGVCWIRSLNTTCTQQQITDMLSGKGVVLNGVWYAKISDYQRPPTSVIAGKPGFPIQNLSSMSYLKGSPSMGATGVYTATFTPTPISRTTSLPFVSVSLGMLWSLGILLILL